MNKTFSIINAIISLLLLVGFIMYMKYKKPKTVPDMNYKTRIVYVDVPYEVKVPYVNGTKPITIIKYRTDSSKLDSLKMVVYDQGIEIQGLEERVRISAEFIKYHTRNPKLIELDLCRDTLSLSLLHIDGNIVQNVYPIFLDHYAYRWTYNQLTHTDLPPPTLEKTNFINFLVGGGVDAFRLSPYLDLRIEKNWSRIRAYSDFQLGLLHKEGSQIRLGIKYKLR